MNIATFAGGCFWGMQKFFNKEFQDAIRQSAVGYVGGSTSNPSYEQVCTGKTGHAEALQLEFNPAKVSYAQLCHLFFRMHDPTQKDRQGNDVGTQYRSAIFAHDNEQVETAKKVLDEVNAKHWQGKIQTKVELIEPSKFTAAEDYHQNYLQKNPTGECNHRLYF